MFLPCPTRGGLLFLAASLAALGAAVMNVGLIIALTASFLLAISVTGFLLALFSVIGCSVSRDTVAEATCLSNIILPVTVKNSLPWFRQTLVLQEKLPFTSEKKSSWEIPPLGPRELLQIQREIQCVKRGHFQLKKIKLIGGDPCGLFKMTRSFRLPCEAVITPRVEILAALHTENSSGHSMNREGRPLGHAGIGSEFFGVRPYREGDEMRSIHWRLSAAKQKLLVREFEASTTDKVIIVLDTCKKSLGFDPVENNFEALISLAASITDKLAKNYCHLIFITRFEGEIIQITGDAAGVRLKVMEMLTELKPSDTKIEEVFADVVEDLPEGAVLYLLSMTASDELKKILHLLEDLSIHLEWVCAAKEYFPFVEPDEPMIMVLPSPEDRFPKVFGPRLLTFKTDPGELFREEYMQE